MRDLCRALLLLTCLATPGLAQDLAGAYELRGHHWSSWDQKEQVVARLELRLRPDGTYDAARRHTYQDGVHGPVTLGRARLEQGALEIEWARAQGATDILTGSAAAPQLKASYRVGAQATLEGSSQSIARDGQVGTFWESGRLIAPASAGDVDPSSDVEPDEPGAGSQTPSDDDPHSIPSTGGEVAGLPANGVFLIGQRVALAGPAVVVAGGAKIEAGQLHLLEAGSVKVRAGDQEVSLQVVQPRVVSVTVLDALPIADAEPPHWRAPEAAGASSAWEPALLLMGQKLRLRVVLAAERALTQPARITLRGRWGQVELSAKSQLDRLAGGQSVELTSSAALSAGVRINQLDIAWSLEDAKGERELAALGETDLRVYTTLAAPRTNSIPRHPQGKPTATKLHLELACTWADGAGQNVASGPDSICERIDNAFRHLVHPSDHGATPPMLPHYAADAAKPLNYDLIPGDTGGSVMNGQRMPSSIFYPDDSDDYDTHYRHNYGWYVLENPRYTGGRCNQQASLIADIYGTVGVRAKVYYIQRVGMGRTNGRPMLRYYVSNISSKSWNFHGVCQATLADGKPWLYDGSGSRPPERINGPPEDLLKVDGTFVSYWKEYWKYADTKERVPQSEWPTEYIGNTGRLEKGQWKGVPLQDGEQPLLPTE